LQGVCHGILADGVIENKEIEQLHIWLSENDHLSTHWPYDELRSLVLSIVSDKKIDEDERLVLTAFINQFVDIKDKNIQDKLNIDTKDVAISGHCTSDPNVVFIDKTFCITGVLSSGPRKEMQDSISKLGGKPVNNVTITTDYLIIGDNGNPAWAFSCYGRKVEKAIGFRKEGHTITLIHEFDFNDILEDNK
jgi:NAD-dependent DNA ligase